MDKKLFSRRNFFKSSALGSSFLLAGTSLSACSVTDNRNSSTRKHPFFSLPGYHPANGTAGLLFSQIGYEPGIPVRIIIRLPKKEILSENATCRLLLLTGDKPYKTSCSYWGEIWKSHWWVAEFPEINEEGEWDIEIHNKGECVIRDTGLKTGKNILWDETVKLASVDILERRVHFTKVGAGWQDAGTLWVESPAQSAMIIALTELLERCPERFDPDFTARIHKQITVGSDYLVMTQDKARELGFPKGSMSHDLLGHEKDILPCDVLKAVIALVAASRVLPDSFKEKKEKYYQSAKLAFDWLENEARPMGDYGFGRFQRGLPENITIPNDEWQTRDLVSFCWASMEFWKTNMKGAKEKAIEYARQIISRQIPKEKAENGFYGHFYEFKSTTHSEKSWVHGIVNSDFGSDIGQFYPNYLMPVIEMLQTWPQHEDAPLWKETLHNFTYGYLIPACEKNPFLLVPQGIFGEEGPVWFCGTFHGTNAVYGFTAALALELAQLFDEKKLRDIAYGNLQWIAGLNAGITTENLKACVVFSTDVPEGLALPASMMCGVGNRWAGTWFQTRGIICNGFSTGKQFVYDVEPKKENDGPFSLTDEDWIPHNAAWLTGLMRLKYSIINTQ